MKHDPVFDTIGFIITLWAFVWSLCKFIELVYNHPFGFVLFIVILSTYRRKSANDNMRIINHG